MQIIDDEFEKNVGPSTYVALGSFDGLHLGHMQLINKVIELSRNNNAKSMVYTFKNHPRSVVTKDKSPKIILHRDNKVELLNELGIDILRLVTFNERFMKVLPEEFILNIVNNYNVKGIVVGFNYRFGYKNLGDICLLKKLSTEYNFELYVINPVKFENEVVSSSRIRHLIAEIGDVKKANLMLTRFFCISGKVVQGNHIGRTISFPTVNLDYKKDFLIPRGGVYFTLLKYKDKLYKGVTNIGYNPTVKNNKLSIETYILNFNKCVYNEEIRIYFINRIRDEKKFDSLKELKLRINKDKEYVESQKIDY